MEVHERKVWALAHQGASQQPILAPKLTRKAGVHRKRWLLAFTRISRLCVIRSRGLVLDKHLPRGDKLEDRTFDGFLIGYDASNIYRVWLPNTNRVIRVRDVRFIDELYKDKPSTLPTTPHMIEAVHIPKEEYDGDTIVVTQPISRRQGPATLVVHTSKDVRQLPSPSHTPDPHVWQQIFQELSAPRASPQTTPGGGTSARTLARAQTQSE
ncbi:hypothetical protein GQ44DRAFT_198129 [Phaeosphaeriaceae sp. PMI808]|nr:hypothetical protein GQ44DRAFT_198129 [Phaeosphaeriaceae sp. PMI808]